MLLIFLFHLSSILSDIHVSLQSAIFSLPNGNNRSSFFSTKFSNSPRIFDTYISLPLLLNFFFFDVHISVQLFPPPTYENNRSLFYPSSSLSLFCLCNISSLWYYLCFLWKFRHSFLTLISAISVQHFVLHNLMIYGDIFLI